jgi:cyclase
MKRNLSVMLLLLPLFAIGQLDLANARIEVTELAPGLHRFHVERVAVLVFHGDEGVLLVDAAYEQSSNRLKEEIDKISHSPLRYIINTHIHGDHTGGNVGLGKGVDIISHHSVKEYLGKDQQRGDRIVPALPEYARPNITFTDHMTLQFNGEEIQMFHLFGGHTEGDIIVYFPKSKVLAVGDLLFAGYFPFVDVGNGGHPMRFMDNLKYVMNNFPENLKFVGGHGPVFNINQLRQYYATLEQTIDVISKARSEGMSMDEMKEKRILKKWEEMGSFFITEDRWIETVYPFL